MAKDNEILANVVAAHAVAVQRWRCALESIQRMNALVNSKNAETLQRTLEIAGDVYADATDNAMMANTACADLMESPAYVGVDYMRQVAHAIDLDAQIIETCEAQALRLSAGGMFA